VHDTNSISTIVSATFEPAGPESRVDHADDRIGILAADHVVEDRNGEYVRDCEEDDTEQRDPRTRFLTP
jgi:hypothetical protein